MLYPWHVVAWAVVAFGLAWGVVAALRRLAPRLGLVDVPNQRSSHAQPTPRGGGLAFVVVLPLVAALASRWTEIPLPEGIWPLFAGCLLVAATGLADDRFGLPSSLRFGAYLAAALLLVADGSYLHELHWSGETPVSLGWLGILFTVFWVVGLTNGYNFMDGIDGIAATQAVVAASTVALLAMASGAPGLALFSATLAGAVGGFIPHNWPKAKIFMGDVGSAFLGFTFAGLALVAGGTASGPVPFLAWVILLAPFLFDSGFTLMRRILRGERWYEAHREHLYQRLVRAGWSHLAVTCLYLAIDLYLAAVVIAHYLYGAGSPAIAVGASLIPLGALAILVGRVEARLSIVARS